MKKLIRIAAWLYPAKWRQRYGTEFQCLLDDAGPKARDLFDVIKGGLAMRVMWLSRFQIVIACTLIGLAPGLLMSWRLPDRYRADAEMLVTVAGTNTPPSTEQLGELTHRIVDDRARLARVVETYNLFDNGIRPYGFAGYMKVLLDPSQRTKSMDEAIDQLKRGMHFEATGSRGGTRLRLWFTSNKPVMAAMIANQLCAFLIEGNLRNAPTSSSALKVVMIDPARIPEQPFWPARPAFAALGATLGAIAGLMVAFLRRPPLQLAA